jgi:hypothetical protein
VELVDQLVIQLHLEQLVVKELLYFVCLMVLIQELTTGSPTVTTGVGGTDTVIVFNDSGSYTG